MNKQKKILRNIIVLVLLIFIFLRSMGLYLRPLSAHRISEKSIHYGPSEVVHVEDFEKRKYILSKYDKWISCNTINKSLFLFWRQGSQVIGIENDETKALNFDWGMSKDNYKFYGIINDDRIEKVEVVLEDKVLTQTEFYDNMFIFTGSISDNRDLDIRSIKAYDSRENIIFQHEYY